MLRKYLAPSSSGDKDYVVTVQSDDGKNWYATNCSCTGYKYRKQCKHSDAVSENPKAFSLYKDGEGVKERVVVPPTIAAGKFRKPMLAGTVPLDKIDFASTRWALEVKFNGHRLIVAVASGKHVLAWARSGKRRSLPSHLVRALVKLPTGLYDGELCAGEEGASWNVTEKTREHEREYFVFDVLEILGQNFTTEPYDRRREALAMIWKASGLKDTDPVVLARSTPVRTVQDVRTRCQEIWDCGGEGVILKDRSAKYEEGVRTKTMLKLKEKHSAVLTLTGFKKGKLGDSSRLLLVDAKGNRAACKVRNFKLLARIDANPKSFLGRQVRIDYQMRTPDGGYFHPRMDRFEDE